MKLRTSPILLLIWLIPLALFAQQVLEEEQLRQEFVKKLEKRRNIKTDKKDKPFLANDPRKIENPEADTEETIKIETQLVRLDVLVYDDKGNIILGLKPEDFVITENKAVQEIGTFSLGDNTTVPRSIVLIMDYSGSQRPYIETSVESAKVLVDKLNPQDRMAIVTDDVELLVDFTNDKESLKKSLNKLKEKAIGGKLGKSLQLSSLFVTIKEMFDNEDIRPIIIFQTDGDQLFKVRRDKGPVDYLPGMTRFTDVEMISTIEKAKVTIYSVISGFSLLDLPLEERIKKASLHLPQEFPKIFKDHEEEIPAYSQILFRQQNSLVNIAKISGGFSQNLETPNQADQIYENILKDIKNRYLLGYYPINQNRDGKRRNVKVEIKNHPEFTVLGRKFYYSPQDKTKNLIK